jgi:hypothetical protein
LNPGHVSFAAAAPRAVQLTVTETYGRDEEENK